MNPPMDDVELKPEKLGKEKDSGPMFHCDLYDTDIVHKIAVQFLPGLASACIDNTTGGLLKSPASVAVDIRREMVDYLIQRSENFVAESVVLEGGPGAELPDSPYDIIADFIEDFANSKRNFVSRVSGWVLSEKREDWIDDFVQEMEINGFWLLNRRIAVAQSLLKNVDMKNTYHCSVSFKSLEDLQEHKMQCSFRTMACTNEGCNARFSAAQLESHDSVCPFKILPCEQNCSESIMRRVMDRHCITTCPMKLVKCPFHSLGCVSTVPQCKVDQHRSEELPSHLLYILQGFHKEASAEDLKERREELEKLSSPGQLASARDARSLTILIKDLEAKLDPMKIKPKATPTEERTYLIDEKENTGLPIKEVESEESKKEESVKSLPKGNDQDNSSQGKAEFVESPANITNKEETVASVPLQENSNESALQSKEGPRSPKKVEVQPEKSSKEDVAHPIEVHSKPPIKQEETPANSTNKEEMVASVPLQEISNKSALQSKEGPKEVEVQTEKSSKEEVAHPTEVHSKSLIKQEETPVNSTNKEETVASVPLQENSKESALQRDEGPRSPKKVELQMEKSSKEEVAHPIAVDSKAPIKQEEHAESFDKREKPAESTLENKASS